MTCCMEHRYCFLETVKRLENQPFLYKLLVLIIKYKQSYKHYVFLSKICCLNNMIFVIHILLKRYREFNIFIHAEILPQDAVIDYLA